MRAVFLMVCLAMAGCEENTTVTNNNGTVTVCSTASALDASDGGSGSADPPGVVATCDDHQPCTWDVQCTPCEAIPNELHIKATCENYADLSPACFDTKTNALIYTGCTHFIYSTNPGVIDDCFPVKFPDDPQSVAHSGVCNQFGICVENP